MNYVSNTPILSQVTIHQTSMIQCNGEFNGNNHQLIINFLILNVPMLKKPIHLVVHHLTNLLLLTLHNSTLYHLLYMLQKLLPPMFLIMVQILIYFLKKHQLHLTSFLLKDKCDLGGLKYLGKRLRVTHCLHHFHYRITLLLRV